MNHLLLDVEAQSRFNFDLRQTINEAKKQPMLTSYTVYTTPSVKPPPDDIKSIVESCGGEFLPKVPSKWPDQTIVISHPDDKPLWKNLKVKGSIPPIVAVEFLLLGVLQHRIDTQSHKIS
ncbi:Mediator of DNA damage checkpoint protein 1 [Homalodisca vitripennis]|nr:Mediator of DNA damage checkpoint protein 1 [Homalodisca vitripennis]